MIFIKKMTITNITTPVNKIKKLIDLNGDKVNFDLTFKVTSKDNTPFEAIVVSQATLDSGSKLDYKKVDNGFISGNIVADKGVYQNYFILLKSEIPTECSVELDIKEIPQQIVVPSPDNKKEENSHPSIIGRNGNSEMSIMKKKHNKSDFNLKKILMIVVFIACAAFIYYYFFYKKNTSNQSSFIEVPTPSVVEVPIPSVVEVPTPSFVEVPTPSLIEVPSIESTFNQNLLSRLNNVKIW